MDRMKNTGPQLLMFDVGGVLVNYSQQVHFGKIAKRLDSECSEVFLRAREFARLLDGGKITVREVERELALIFDCKFEKTAGIWKEAFEKSVSQNRFVVNVAQKLARRGHDVVLATNKSVGAYRSLFGRGGVLRSFSGFPIFASCYLGVSKPDQRYFRLVLQKMNSSPGRAIFIDDNSKNILSAQSLGIRSIRYSNNDKRLARSLARLDIDI